MSYGLPGDDPFYLTAEEERDEITRQHLRRYQWLRENCQYQEGIGPVLRSNSPSELDAAIDAAMKECRWATRAEQRRNQRGCIHITHCDQTRTLEEWSRELGIPAQTIRRRYRKGVHGDALFSVPNAVKSSAGKCGNASRWSAIAAQDAK